MSVPADVSKKLENLESATLELVHALLKSTQKDIDQMDIEQKMSATIALVHILKGNGKNPTNV